jgi:diguanylate cyclase (GGDEF)-like protein/PAS domain S-box-containing protein
MEAGTLAPIAATTFPVGSGELGRLAVLDRYEVFDTVPEPAFDRLARLARRLFGVPIALISFVGEHQQRFKARCGLDIAETDLTVSFCRYAIRDSEVMVVLDAAADPRFRDNPLVTGAPNIRFYAGAPIITPDGHALGTLCIIDDVPRPDFSADQQAALAELAALVTSELELRDAVRRRLATEARMRLILAQLPTVVWTTDRTLRLSAVSGLEQVGLSSQNVVGLTLPDLFDAKDAGLPLLRAHQEALLGRSGDYEVMIGERSFQARVEPFRDEAGRVIGCIGVALDISERLMAERERAREGEFRRQLAELMETSLSAGSDALTYQRLLEGAVTVIPGAQSGSLLVWDGERYRFAAAAGFDLAALQGCSFAPEQMQRDTTTNEPTLIRGYRTENYDPEQRETLCNAGQANAIKVTLSVPVRVAGRSVAFFNLDNVETPDAFGTEAIEMARIFAQQVGSLFRRHELEEELRHLANHDALTGLPNRRLFQDRLELALAQSRRSGQALAIVFADLDNFKDVNDTHGHDLGDALIRQVATRLAACVREGDTLARWGGDEFVLLVQVEDACGAAAVAEKLLGELRRPFQVKGLELRTGASLGIGLWTGGATGADELVKHADLALYRAKVARGGYCFYDEGMTAALRERVELGEELRAAIETGQIMLHYQPRVALATGVIGSVEALARWRHPTRGFVPPAIFIPLAEELGLIHLLGANVLDAACAQARAWRDAGTPFRVAVNLSVEQLKHPSIVAEVRAALARYALAPALLELEITESTAMTDVEDAIGKLRDLRALGVRLAIDDFGTAYSSLAYLRRLPVHSLKIDRSFVRGLTESEADAGIVRAILALGRTLGLEMVAEGVETEAQRLALLGLGCDAAQGYLFGPPLPAPELSAYLSVGTPAVPLALAAT